MKHIVMFSGGVGSWMTARRLVDSGIDGDLVLIFADTLMEDPDLYRFLDEAADNVGGRLLKLAEGRDPWQVFKDEKFLGNSRIDPCSKILKRKLLRRFIEDNYDPETSTIYLGVDWTEEHRLERARGYWHPWRLEAPLCSPPYLSKKEMLVALADEGIEPPQLYSLGFPHNNCGGFCIKAGQAQFRLLLKTFPERYKFHEEKEQDIRKYLDKDVAILRDRRGGSVRPLTLKEFRERIEEQPALLLFLGIAASII